jgi:hypothetical protein
MEQQNKSEVNVGHMQSVFTVRYIMTDYKE